MKTMVTFLGTKDGLKQILSMADGLLDLLRDDIVYYLGLDPDGNLTIMREIKESTSVNSKMGRPKKYNNVSRSKKRHRRLAS